MTIKAHTSQPRARRLAFACLRISLVTLICAIGLSGASVIYFAKDFGLFDLNEDSLTAIVTERPKDNTIVYDRNAEVIGEFFSSYQLHTPYREIPQQMIEAIIAIEDREFFSHHGFSPRGIVRAAWNWVKTGKPGQGASTITQQVVRRYLLSSDKTIIRKLQEIALAIQLEKIATKPKIIEIYANTFFLGNGAYGVAAAAKRYFGKELKALDPAEMALIAGLFQSPSRLDPTSHPKAAKKRQLLVLQAMKAAGFISEEQRLTFARQPLKYLTGTPLSANSKFAPYFLEYVKKEAATLLSKRGMQNVDSAGLRIYTTLDPHLQSDATQALAENRSLLESAERLSQGRAGKKVEAALLSVDPKTGEILAMIGGRDFSRSQFNRAADSLRQPGSAFKPVVFSLALASKWRWSDTMIVAPVSVGGYRPQTSREEYLLSTTLLRAFYKSINAPVIELGNRLGLTNVVTHAKKLGIESPIKQEFGSLLGSSEVSMLDMARVYGVFASGGKRVQPIAITRIDRISRDGHAVTIYNAPKAQERTQYVMSPQVSYLMTQGMRDVLAMGTGYRAAEMADIAAGKTGTSNDSADNWFCGYTPNLVTISWVGTDKHSGIYGSFTGGTLALPVWMSYMQRATPRRSAERFEMPDGVVATRVNPNYGTISEGGVRMYFLRGREPDASNAAADALQNYGGRNATNGYRDIFSR